MTEPIDASVGCLLLYIAGDRSVYHNIATAVPDLLNAVVHADALKPCPIRHLGKPGTMDWPYLSLTGFGETVVEEMIAAARAVTHTEARHG